MLVRGVFFHSLADKSFTDKSTSVGKAFECLSSRTMHNRLHTIYYWYCCTFFWHQRLAFLIYCAEHKEAVAHRHDCNPNNNDKNFARWHSWCLIAGVAWSRCSDPDYSGIFHQEVSNKNLQLRKDSSLLCSMWQLFNFQKLGSGLCRWWGCWPVASW